jgi:MFS family permease
MASGGGPLDPFGTQLGGLELNVTVAGLEAVLGTWLVMRLPSGLPLTPNVPDEWQWSYAVAAILAVVGIFLAGLIVEGIAGLVEIPITRKRGGNLRSWYQERVKPPTDWGTAQRWMWQSPQAAAEFGRRRTRILVARNTAACFLGFSIALAIAYLITRGLGGTLAAVLSLLVGLVGCALFTWVWLAAHSAWNRAVRDAGDIGPPH